MHINAKAAFYGSHLPIRLASSRRHHENDYPRKCISRCCDMGMTTYTKHIMRLQNQQMRISLTALDRPHWYPFSHFHNEQYTEHEQFTECNHNDKTLSVPFAALYLWLVAFVTKVHSTVFYLWVGFDLLSAVILLGSKVHCKCICQRLYGMAWEPTI